MDPFVVVNSTIPAVVSDSFTPVWNLYPELTLELFGFLVVPFLTGFLVAFILTKLMRVGLALLSLVVLLSLFGSVGVAEITYTNFVDSALPPIVSYSAVLYRLATAQLPWSLLAMLLGGLIAIFGFFIPSFHRTKV